MIIRISQLRMNLCDADQEVCVIAARALHLKSADILSARLVRKSVDARDKRDVHFSITIDAEIKRMPAHLPTNAKVLEEEPPRIPLRAERKPSHRPIVVGMGPAGLFAALQLAQAGLAPLVIERGREVDRRAQDVENFWATGTLDPDSNVQFGEGGAGTFSDGKLNTGIKDERCKGVLQTFQRMGAPEEILYSAHPHIGTDHLRYVVKNIRQEILSLGGEVRFETKLTGLKFSSSRLTAACIEGEWVDAEHMILAIGHSARDSFQMLFDAGVFMEQKAFSLGARIEHSQKMISRAQYGAAAEHPSLGAADYKLFCHLGDGRTAYTFCMCPGGKVVAAASEEGGVAVNGMSLYARDGENANSALLVSVAPGDYGADDPLAGVRFQQKWERRAFELGGSDYRAPAQLVGDFLKGRASKGAADVAPMYRPGVRYTKLDSCLPSYVIEGMRTAIVQFDRKLHGFAHPGAVLTGVETRSSSPLRITRGENHCALGVQGLYPCGEGAGYAGGILSAAVDGLRCAESLIKAVNQGEV